jgi:hypothetical protein
MSPKEYADPEDEPQTPEEVEEVSEGDAAGVQDQEEDGDRAGTEARPLTMEERKAKMQQLRAKLVGRVLSLSFKPSSFDHSLTNSAHLRSRTVPP